MLSDLGQWMIVFPVSEPTTSMLIYSYLCVHMFDEPEPSFSFLRHEDFKVGYCNRRACECHLEAWGRRCPSVKKQMDLKKDNVSRFSWEKVICCVLSADGEEWGSQISRNFSLMMHFN